VSTTYDICCDECRVALWIGQVSASRTIDNGLFLYGKMHAGDGGPLPKFLGQHIGHPLVFIDSASRCIDVRREGYQGFCLNDSGDGIEPDDTEESA
jgi:hypothetical protein